MDERKYLEARGYCVGTKYLAVHWMCSLEWHNQMKSFYGATESEAITLALRYVKQLEESYKQQQDRQRCEGCGE